MEVDLFLDLCDEACVSDETRNRNATLGGPQFSFANLALRTP
jgi:hypothetical protein